MKILRWLFGAIALLVIVGLTIANRDSVRLSLDPIDGPQSAWSIEAPLFVVAYGALILGVLLGVTVEWMAQGKWRKSARTAKSEISTLTRDLQKVQEQLAAREQEITARRTVGTHPEPKPLAPPKRAGQRF